MKKKLTIRQKEILQALLMIVFGLAIITFGIFIPGKWLIKDKAEIREEIDLTNFKGEVYRTSDLRINPQILIEKPSSQFYTFLKNPESIISYSNGTDSFSTNIKIYRQEFENSGKFYWVQKDYTNEIGRYNIKYEDGKITVTRYPAAGSYIVFFVMFFICMWFGVVQIKNNIKKIRIRE